MQSESHSEMYSETHSEILSEIHNETHSEIQSEIHNETHSENLILTILYNCTFITSDFLIYILHMNILLIPFYYLAPYDYSTHS